MARLYLWAEVELDLHRAAGEVLPTTRAPPWPTTGFHGCILAGPAPRPLVASLVSVKGKRKRRLKVVVRYADTGEVKAEFNSPFQRSAYRKIAVRALDTNSDGATDAVQVTGVRRGLRKKTVKRVIPV